MLPMHVEFLHIQPFFITYVPEQFSFRSKRCSNVFEVQLSKDQGVQCSAFLISNPPLNFAQIWQSLKSYQLT